MDASGRAEARAGILLAAGAFLCWGLLSPGNEILLREFTPMWMQAIRSGLASLVLLIALPRRHIRGAWQALGEPRVVAAVGAGGVLGFSLFVLAQTRIEAAFTTLGFYTAPIWTALLARAWLKERLGRRFWPAVILLMAGGYLALTGGTAAFPDAIGMALAVGSGVAWALYAVLLRRIGDDHSWQSLVLAATLVGTVAFTVASVFEADPDFAQISGSGWLWTIIVTVIPTLAALAMFQMALQRTEASKVNMLVGLELAGAFLFAAILLGARYSPLQLVGLAVVIAAVTWYLMRPGRSAQTG